jgi:hypothetical protein
MNAATGFVAVRIALHPEAARFRPFVSTVHLSARISNQGHPLIAGGLRQQVYTAAYTQPENWCVRQDLNL